MYKRISTHSLLIISILSMLLCSGQTHAQVAIVTAEDISSARMVIEKHLPVTPCIYSYALSDISGATVYLKLENMQATGAFKERGALNKLSSLTPAERESGVIAASTGNHAQGVSYHARRLGIPATIVMPMNTPANKVERTRALGASVILKGETFDDAAAIALNLASDEQRTFIHPYNDPLIIAGQGTIAAEMLEQIPQLDTLIIPIGGGGLISGCSVAAKAIKPDIHIIGVESKAYSAMKQTLRRQPVSVGGPTLAEGMAVRNVGSIPVEIIRQNIEEIIVVDEKHIEQAIALLAENARTVAEGAGATPLAALLQYPEQFVGRNVGLLISGGNIDNYELAMILQRSMVTDGQLVEFNIAASDRPDQLGAISRILDQHGAIIRGIRNNIVFGTSPLKTPDMIFTIETHSSSHAERLLALLNESGIHATQLKHD